jgi:peroxiredoxin
MCGPCLHEMRDIRDLANHYKDSKNVVVVSVSLQDTKADILKTAETYAPGFEKNLIIIPASILGNLFDGYQKTTNSSFKNATKEFFKRQYKISSVPVSLIIDKEGIVRVVLSGFDKKYEHLDFYRSETENVLMKKNR